MQPVPRAIINLPTVAQYSLLDIAIYDSIVGNYEHYVCNCLIFCIWILQEYEYIYIILCLEDVIIFLENLVLKNFLIINASSNF